MDFIVRDGLSDEAAEVLRVKNASWQAAYRGLLPDDYLDGLTVTPATLEGWRRMMAAHDRGVVVGESGQQIVGLSAFGPAAQGEAGGEIYAIYVLPEHWSTGLGRALMARSLERLRELGHTEVGLWVFAGNPRARRFYERAGFTLSGRQETAEGPGFAEPEVHYRLALEEQLAGGMANAGAVVRRGDVVDRPAPPNAAAIHTHLNALADLGFDAAPRPVGLGADGREQLTFVAGDVAVPPYPAWALTDEALRSVGALLRRYHDAAADVPAQPPWSGDLSDPRGGSVVCHNDVCLENVVFRDGQAAALIDFDLAAPGRPLWDLAMAARYWVPMLDPESARLSGRGHLDPGSRLRVLADGYGLSAADRADLLGVIEEATAVARAFVAARVDSGDQVFVQAMADHGGWARWDRVQAWRAAHQDAFTELLLAPIP